MSDDIVRQIRDKLPILQLAGDHGLHIQQKGNRHFVLCPWHNEKSGSAELYTNQNKGYCHGCKKRFDSIDLWAYFNNCTTKEALKILAERFGINNQQQIKKRIVATYDYCDKEGRLLYQALRFEPKGFYQRRPDGKGGWINNLDGVELVPYQLTALLIGIEQGNKVYIVEGEKDVHTLQQIGLTATCNSGGAGKWKQEHSVYIPEGAEVIILPDNDPPGQEHAEMVTSQLLSRGCRVRVVNLPDLPPKGDVTDWLQVGHTKDELLQLVSNTEYITECVRVVEQSHVSNIVFHYTELGSAERLLHQNAGNIRYCPEISSFLLWDGKRWEKNNDGGIKRLIIKMVKDLHDTRNIPEPEVQLKWAKSCESRAKLESIAEIVKFLPDVPLSINEIDKEKYLINCMNGTINLKSGELMPHNKKHNISHLLPYTYKPYNVNADCRQWIKFLCEITNNDLEVMRYLWKLAGLCLSGDTTEHVLNIFYGANGRNGKGVFLEMIQRILGELQCVMPFATFEPKNAGGIPNDVARIAGKRLVIAQESNEGKRLDEAVIKSLTGGDMLTGRFLRAEYFDFFPTHKIILVTNNKPVIKETSNAIWSRIRLIPFEVSFAGREDKKLREKLESELPEILAWMVAGFAEWQSEGLQPPQSIKDACNEYRSEEDVVQTFIDENCYINENCQVGAKELYQTFIKWCEVNGEKPIGKKIFNNRIRGRGFNEVIGSWRMVKFIGIGLANIERQKAI
ncbi:phage/plasmid primase, P4 family [Pelosinus sp. IPA-1]|uniref:phage/plasmid primase, P4 family n=1 Tax=Pelosinus sp. IPA-1 TaxID=3029569 RepID=UPI0024361B19|nr:phage/plasmid primase, P4 family [Pelosinus sp. IPA-1]GMB01862.1 hypothetical protein PIPA1_46620 [Pelosinus sp. IPA-1]